MKVLEYFDHVFESEMNFSDLPVKNISELIFKKMNERNEEADVILSHVDNVIVKISLKRLRHIVFTLYNEFEKKEIKSGDTVLLASISGNNELFTSLLFLALSSYGVKVFLPMYLETNDLLEWLEKTQCTTVIIPEKEIFAFSHHEKEKSTINTIKEVAFNNDLICYDIFEDFNFPELLQTFIPEIDYLSQPIVLNTINNTCPETEAMLITTSGSEGKSKIVVYNQGSFIKCCMSWQKAGFYNRDKLGGRGFTPLFTHTMGVRAFFNALWTGVPVCLIKTEWFEEKPETVRYFLMEMKPEHITGGPSVYNLILEIIRNFPELRLVLKNSLKTLISSGAPLDPSTVANLESSFDLKMFNAFGTTETQQALSTLLYENNLDIESNYLGIPLPGITVGLKKVDGSDKFFRLFVKSEFGMKRILDKKDLDNENQEDFFNTGDLVELINNKNIQFIGRDKSDFLKDGFGVKLSLNVIKDHFKKLHQLVNHIEYYTLKFTPGLALLIFISDNNQKTGHVTDEKTINDYKSVIESININMNKNLEPFEYRHRMVNRFTIVNSAFPKTVKGNPSSFRINELYGDIIKKLVDELSNDPFIIELKSLSGVTDTFTKFHNPYLGHLLSALCIDKTYHKAQKDSLFTYVKGKETEVLDMVGGYGSNLLGHNNLDLKNSVISFLENNEVAISDQGSIQNYAGMLAEQLNFMLSKNTGQSFKVLFGSSGSEVVEIALHHALFEWKKRIENIQQEQFQKFGAFAGKLLKEVWESNKQIIDEINVHVFALKKSFHGSTSGARSVLSNNKKREAFKNMLGLSAIFIDDTSEHWQIQIEKELKAKTIKLKQILFRNKKYIIGDLEISTVIAAIAEPVIGEGGIRNVNTNVLKQLSKNDFPLILDEIQCGLGRSGSIPTLHDVKANYYLFGKSLGGNIEKISAILIDNTNYKPEFGKYYSSTFANGGLAASIALRTLAIIKEQNIPEKALLQGEKIRQKLNRIKTKYPSIISNITGSGLMQGIEFSIQSNDTSAFLRNIHINEYSGLLYSSYLLNKHNIRIFPTLSAPNVLRIEPSAFISDSEIERFANAIEDLVDKLDKRQYYELFSPLMDGDPFDDNKGKLPDDGFMDTSLEEPLKNAVKVAVVAHFVHPPEELRLLEKDFCKASDTGLRILFNRLQLLLQMKPFVIMQKNLFGGKIHFTFITIPVDSAELERLNRKNKRKNIINKIQDAVNLAGDLGIEVISLGAYTSILSNNGLSLVEPEKTKIITGNTLTAASGIHRIIEEIKATNQCNGNNIMAVIGASGNIGSVIAEGLLESDIPFEKVYLIGRNKNKLTNTLKGIKNSIRSDKKTKIEISTDLLPLKKCNIIIVATNTNDPIIHTHHLSQKHPIILSDLSVPAAISKEVKLMKNIINIPFASYIHLPDNPEIKISSHTPRGAVFCCVAEAMLYGLEPVNLSLKGHITMDGIKSIKSLAEKHHFFDNLGKVKTYKTTY